MLVTLDIRSTTITGAGDAHMSKSSLRIAVFVVGGLVVIGASADAATGGKVSAAAGEFACCACAWLQSLLG